MKKYIAEGFGTFVLTLVVALSLTSFFSIETPLLAALTVGLFVYALADISGGHVNPAVTIGLWSIKKISSSDALKYIFAQFLGGALAFFIFSVISAGEAFSVATPSNSFNIFVAEFVGMFIYAFFIASFVCGRVPSQLFGIFIGSALLLGIVVAMLIGSEGWINPAVALGVRSLNLAYLLAPLAGSMLGMNAFKLLDGCKSS